jgi:glycosyltransferase involved in cell wall biosynthesis
MLSRALRVLHVSTWNVPCGIATYCANLVKSLTAEGVTSDVYPLQPHAWQSFLPQDAEALLSDIQHKAKDFDLVHIQHEHGLFGCSRGNGYAAKQYGRLLDKLKAIGRPALTTFHTEVSPGSQRATWYSLRFKEWTRGWKWRRLVARHFGSQPGQAQAVVHTELTRFSFAQAGLPTDAIHVLPHPCLPPRKLVLDRQSAKAKLDLPGDSRLLTIFGFIGRYKGHDIALSALKYLPDNYHLAIVGGMHPESRDDFAEHLLANVRKRKLQSRVKITGWVDEETAALYYAATNICLAPYRPFANLSASGAITWALNSGRPVIASKIDAFQAIHREANCLMMVTPEQERELAWAIEKLAGDERLQHKLVSASLGYCEKHSWSRNAQSVLSLYGKLLGRELATTPGIAQAA